MGSIRTHNRVLPAVDYSIKVSHDQLEVSSDVQQSIKSTRNISSHMNQTLVALLNETKYY